LNVRAHVHGTSSTGYAAKVSFTSPEGSDERYLEHPSCAQLVNAVALVVALAIDPERVHARQLREPSSPAPQPSVAPSAASAPPRAASVVSVEEAQARVVPARGQVLRREPLRGLRAALDGLMGAGPLPSFGEGIQAAVGWERGRFRIEALGRYWLARHAVVAFAPSAALDLRLSTLGTRGCWLPLAGEWRFSGCVGGDVGDLRGEGINVENERTRHARYSDLAAGFAIAYTHYRLAPEAGLDFAWALERPRFGVKQNGRAEEVFRPGAWGFAAFFGFAFEL
jgi:hypothetical protein